jgi:hypothetical protein
MTYDCPTWVLAVDTHLMKLQRLQNKVLRTLGAYRSAIFTWLSTCLAYAYAYMTKLCRQQAQVVLNHGNENIRNIGQGEARHRKCKEA